MAFSHAKVLGKRGEQMIQRLIELGEGYADIYELCELAENMTDRITHFVSLRTEKVAGR